MSTTITLPSKIQNMTQVKPGVYKSSNFAKDHVAVLFFKATPKYGQTVRKTVIRASNVPVSGQWNDKVERNWRGVGGYPNFYAGTQTSGQMIFYTEKLTPSKATRFYFTWPGHVAGGQQEVWEYRMPSGVGKADGAVKVTIGAKVVLNKTGWQCDSATYPGLPNTWCFQEVISGTPKLASNAFVSFTSPKLEII